MLRHENFPLETSAMANQARSKGAGVTRNHGRRRNKLETTKKQRLRGEKRCESRNETTARTFRGATVFRCVGLRPYLKATKRY